MSGSRRQQFGDRGHKGDDRSTKFIDICKSKCLQHFLNVIMPEQFAYIDFTKPKMVKDISLGILKSKKFVISEEWPIEYSIALLPKREVEDPKEQRDYEFSVHLY